ncbi:scarecrow-like protein 6 [Oryza brachyantha]|uniref:scarecrow-like protein 6 n=1 Tax=Oryza brachyantha TaxID=4533 RepID=UPI001ADAE714|nr:scarecrow-like protein 6 [Oryza brachyantha]XP_040381190.1 scarecrow-like protein 6 [Oryza brachyantha]
MIIVMSSSCHPHDHHHTKSPEPTSVLYNRSPSPPTSSSLGSCSSKPLTTTADDWEAVLGDMVTPAALPQDSSFLRWIMDAGYADGDGDGDAFGFKGPAFPDPFDSLLPPPPQDDPPQAQAQALVDELLDAARRLHAGDSTSAMGILARLNHRLPSLPPPGHPPLLRAAALLRDALLRLLQPTALPHQASVSSPLDVPLKLAAHKALADASPTVQFASFTSTQAFLDALGAARRVHLLDFDIGFGGHWPPLMQELAHQWRRAAVPLPPPTLKVTALVSPGTRHPLELHLTYESLTRFAAELGIAFEFTALAFDPLSASPPMGLADEAVAVHLPAGSATFSPAPAHLRVVKELRPAVVVCVDHGCERGDLPLPHHALNLLRSSAALLESLDTAGASPDVVSKIEQFILRPRVEHLALGGDKLPPLQSMFASGGFAPLQLSNAAEAQAECLLRRTANHGFHVEKRQAALALWWQRSELVSVSAWRC